MHPGVNTRDLATHLSQWAAQRGFTVNRRGAGHAIGSQMHMKPNIYNTPEDVHEYAVLEKGQVFCIEPALTKSSDSMGVLLSDNWTIVTLDRQYAAMFEHMVEITEDGCKVLTTHFDRAKY
jgi:methionyl aminopeptidase